MQWSPLLWGGPHSLSLRHQWSSILSITACIALAPCQSLLVSLKAQFIGNCGIEMVRLISLRRFRKGGPRQRRRMSSLSALMIRKHEEVKGRLRIQKVLAFGSVIGLADPPEGVVLELGDATV